MPHELRRRRLTKLIRKFSALKEPSPWCFECFGCFCKVLLGSEGVRIPGRFGFPWFFLSPETQGSGRLGVGHMHRGTARGGLRGKIGEIYWGGETWGNSPSISTFL